MKWGKADFRQFQKLARNIQGAAKGEMVDEAIIKIVYELANRTLAKTKERTPVGQYTEPGRVGGHLRRNWFITSIQKNGPFVYVEIYNNVEYASFVENGHRTRLGTGVNPPKPNGIAWVEGRFMLTISIKEIEEMMPTIVEKHQKEFLKKLVNV